MELLLKCCLDRSELVLKRILSYNYGIKGWCLRETFGSDSRMIKSVP